MRYLLLILLLTGCSHAQYPYRAVVLDGDREVMIQMTQSGKVKCGDVEYDSREQSMLRTIVEGAVVQGMNNK